MSFWKDLLRPRYRLSDPKQRNRAQRDFLRHFGQVQVPPDNQPLYRTNIEWREREDDWDLLVECQVTPEMKHLFPFVVHRQPRPKPAASTGKSGSNSTSTASRPAGKKPIKIRPGLQGGSCPTCGAYLSDTGRSGPRPCRNCGQLLEATD